MNKTKIFKLLFIFLIAAGSNPQLKAAAATELTVKHEVDPSKVIPLSITGFSGEAASVLRFDLEISGFQIVPPEEANYQLSGQNDQNVEGRLATRNSRSNLFGMAYTTGTLRSQAHALANDVVKAIWGHPGIGNTTITFKVDTGRNSEVYISDFDGYKPQAITQDNTVVAAPCWVPGGRALLYTSYRSGYPDIYYHDFDKQTRQIIAKYPGLNTSAAVSRDGQRVAMILSKGGSPDLYVSDLDGRNLKQLTTTKEDESSPCWSPDGSTICFVSRSGGRPGLYTIPASGGTMRKLSVANVGSVTEPDWSPDGKSIIFTVMRGEFELAVVPAEGGEATTLVTGEDPSWGPNSRTVIFVRRQGGRRNLSLLDVPTKRVKDVKQISGSSSQPCWSK